MRLLLGFATLLPPFLKCCYYSLLLNSLLYLVEFLDLTHIFHVRHMDDTCDVNNYFDWFICIFPSRVSN